MNAVNQLGRALVNSPCPLKPTQGPRADTSRPFRLLCRDAIRLSLPQAKILDRRRQSLGLVALAVACDLCGIPLKAVVVQDFAIGSRIVITAHPKTNEIPFFRTVSEPPTASDLIHVCADLSSAW
jgi:hypothetical protein